MATTSTPATIVETIAINAPVAAVFAALTVPDQVVQWWGSDESHRVRDMQSDLRTGGAWKTTGVTRDNESFTVSGVYRIVEPPHLLEFTWRNDWSDGTQLVDTVVRYELVEHDGGTRLTLTHSGFTTQTDRDDHARGWKTVLMWLRDFVTKDA